MKSIATRFTRILSMLYKDTPKPVGRWRIENCDTAMNTKIDLSNEDHCGPCGQYALAKIETQKNIVVYNEKSNPKSK